MSESPPNAPVQTMIPESLRRQLEDFRKVLWRIKVFEAVVAGLIGLFVSFLLVFGLDRIWQTPQLVRLVILLAGTSLFAVFAPYWLHRWVWGHRRETQLARLIAKRYPGLGDRLLGVVELQDQHEDADRLSPRLREAAMLAVAAEAGKRNFKGALPPPRHRKLALWALLLAGGTAAVMTLAPRAGLNALQRWLMPLSETERYTFTHLEPLQQEFAVPFGESFEIALHLSKDSEQRPGRGTARFAAQPEIEAKRKGRMYAFSFPGQQDAGIVEFKVGDARVSTKVMPVQRPTTEQVTARVTPPAYLQIPARDVELANGVLSAVNGSHFSVTLRTNRELARAGFGPTTELKKAEPSIADAPMFPRESETTPPQAPFESAEGELALDGLIAGTPEISVGVHSFELPFQWTDKLGLSNNRSYKLRVDSLADSPPGAYIQGLDRQKVMLPEETIDFDVLAEDDFGVTGVGIEWYGEFSAPTDEVPAKGELEIAKGGPEERRVGSPASFSPIAFGITPQRITLRAYTEDLFPGRGRVYSDPFTVYVLTRDEHAQLLMNQFDRAIAELEDVARRELNQFDQNQRLERLDGEKLQEDDAQKDLAIQEQEEAENVRRMEELTQRMEKLLMDAARNGEVEKETMKKMAEALKSMQELSKEDMPEVEEKLGDTQENTNTPEKTEQDLKEAVEKQKEVVEKMQKAIEQANDANEKFEAGTFVNRLKKAATDESGISNSLREVFEKVLGLKTPELDPTDQRRIAESHRQQSDTGSDVRWIQEDLAHYHARTQKEPFKEILDEMRDSEIDQGLEAVKEMLNKSHTYAAAEKTLAWAAQLNEWAAKLESANQEGGGGGEGGGSPNSEDEDFEFMLRVMKMVQQQQDLRSRTRTLEQLRRTDPDYQPDLKP